MEKINRCEVEVLLNLIFRQFHKKTVKSNSTVVFSSGSGNIISNYLWSSRIMVVDRFAEKVSLSSHLEPFL